jgi:hypothetical protein
MKSAAPRFFPRGAVALHLVLIVLFSGFYFALVLTLAARKQMWFDEILTHHLAALPSVSAIWNALSDGPDNSPPLNLVFVHAIYRVIGASDVTARLPSIFGVWLMSLCLFAFVTRRCAPVYAWAAMLFPLTTQALQYAYEARPYGLWMGWCALSLVAWQSAASDRRRALALPGLTASLAAAVCTHFYAPVGFIPIGLAELVRTWRRRRVDVLMWLAMLAGLVPLLFYGPLIRNANAYTAVFHSRPGLASCLIVYTWLLASSLPALVGALVVLALDAWRPPNPSESSLESRRPLSPLDEVVAALGFAGVPIFAMVLSRLAAGGAFVERYSLPAVIGLSILVALVASRIVRQAATGALLALVLFAGATLHGYLERQSMGFANPALWTRLKKLESLKDSPLATDDAWQYIVLQYYCPLELNDRLTFLSGIGNENAELCLQRLVPWVAQQKLLRIDDYRAFVASHDRFVFFFGSSGGGLIGAMGNRLQFQLDELSGGTSFCHVSRAQGSDEIPRGAGRATTSAVPRDLQ